MKNLLRVPNEGPYLVDGKGLMILTLGMTLIGYGVNKILASAFKEGALVSTSVLHAAAQDAANQSYALGAEAAVATVMANPGVYGLQVQDTELARTFAGVVLEPDDEQLVDVDDEELLQHDPANLEEHHDHDDA